MRAALLWLKENNAVFRNYIEINQTRIDEMEEEANLMDLVNENCIDEPE